MSLRISAIASMATRGLLEEVVDAWCQSRGIEVALEAVGGVAALERVQAGEPFDVIVLTAAAIDQLIAAGRIVSGSRTDLVRSEVVIAVRSGVSRPAVDSEDALRNALLAARGGLFHGSERRRAAEAARALGNCRNGSRAPCGRRRAFQWAA